MALDELFLPLLLPPPLPAGAANEERYANYVGTYAVVDGGDGSLVIETVIPVTQPEAITVVTPQPCTLTFLPVASAPTLPDGAPATEDTIVLNVYPSETLAFGQALPGRPAPSWWALSGIDLAQFTAQLDVWKELATQQQLDLAWTSTAVTPMLAEAKDNWKARVLLGEVDVPLEAGVAIADLDAASYRLVVRLYDIDSEPLHPAIALPAFGDANPDLVGHPLLGLVGDVDVDIQIFVQFQYFAVDNEGATKGRLAPLAGALVSVRDAAIPGGTLQAQTADVDGRATFYVSSWDWFGTADIYFSVFIPRAKAVLRQHGRVERWDGTWTTFREGLIGGVPSVPAVDGSPGYLPDYAGWSIGTASRPLVFYLGTPVMLTVAYGTRGLAAWRPVPRGTVVELGHRTGSDAEPFTVDERFYADEDGEVWGTAFELAHGEDLEIRLPLQIAEDANAGFVDSIELPSVATLFHPGPWLSKDRDPTNLFWAAFNKPILGDAAAPLALRVDHTPDDEVAATLFLLKCVRDTHLWLHEMTGGEWKGIEGCWVHLNDTWVTNVIDYLAAIGHGHMTSMNPPQLGVILHARDKWDRDTCVHEIAHGLMWGTAAIDLATFACAIVTSQYGNHSPWRELSDFAAMVEGWANIVANAVGGGGRYSIGAAPPRWVEDLSGTTVEPMSIPGLGSRIENCFAGAFWNHLHGVLGVEPCVDVDEKDLHMDGSPSPVPNTTLRPASAGFDAVLWNPISRLQREPVFVPGTGDLLLQVEWSLGPTGWAAFSAGFAVPWNLIAPPGP